MQRRLNFVIVAHLWVLAPLALIWFLVPAWRGGSAQVPRGLSIVALATGGYLILRTVLTLTVRRRRLHLVWPFIDVGLITATLIVLRNPNDALFALYFIPLASAVALFNSTLAFGLAATTAVAYLVVVQVSGGLWSNRWTATLPSWTSGPRTPMATGPPWARRARPKAAIAMLLDQSNSMNFDSGIGPGIARKDVLRFSAPTAVIVLDDQHSMAVSTFDQDAHPGIGLTLAAGAGKVAINAAIAAYAPNPNGWTAIGEGVAFAQGLLAPATGFDVKAMIVLTDGQEEHGPYARRYIADVTDLINSLNGRVFAIGLGRAEILNPTALQSLCSGNNGYLLLTGDLNPDATYRLAKYYQQIFAGVTNNEIVLDPDGFVTFGVEQRIPFWLNETDIEAKCILLTPAPYAIRYVLETPDGEIIDPGVAAANPNASFGAGGQVAFYRVGLPIPLGAHEAQAGRWYARLAIDDRRLTQFSTFEQPASAFASAAHGLRYSFTVQAYSNLRMRALLAQTSNEPGATLTVRAVLTEYGLPVASRALCGADLTRPDGTGATLGMPEIEPGVFERTVTASLPGIYRFRVVGAGRTLRGRPFTREQTLTGAVWKGGDATPPTLKDDPSARDDRFCRLIDCLLHEKTIQATLRKAGINLDELLRCLEDYCRKPSPGQPPCAVRPKLEDRLRSIIRDNPVLQAVMHELQQEKE